MLIAIAAAIAVSSTAPAAPAETEKPAVVKLEGHGVAGARCDAGVVQADSIVRYDHSAANAPTLDREPYRGDVLLFSAVERKVGGCSLPVIRARTTDSVGGVIEVKPAPIDR